VARRLAGWAFFRCCGSGRAQSAERRTQHACSAVMTYTHASAEVQHTQQHADHARVNPRCVLPQQTAAARGLSPPRVQRTCAGSSPSLSSGRLIYVSTPAPRPCASHSEYRHVQATFNKLTSPGFKALTTCTHRCGTLTETQYHNRRAPRQCTKKAAPPVLGGCCAYARALPREELSGETAQWRATFFLLSRLQSVLFFLSVFRA
jgi:hypothetical protein